LSYILARAQVEPDNNELVGNILYKLAYRRKPSVSILTHVASIHNAQQKIAIFPNPSSRTRHSPLALSIRNSWPPRHFFEKQKETKETEQPSFVFSAYSVPSCKKISRRLSA
jgi:hypothetical protein